MLAQNSKFSASKYDSGRPKLTLRDMQALWACQCCGERQSPCCDPFVLYLDGLDYLRVCSACMFVKILIPEMTLSALILNRRKFADTLDLYRAHESLEHSPLLSL